MKRHIRLLLLTALVPPLAAQSTVRVSVGTGGVQLPTSTANPSVSGGGRFVVFSTNSPLLSPNALSQIFVRDRDPDGDGLFDEANAVTTLISRSATGQPGNGASGQASISDDGRWVAFSTGSTNFSVHFWVAGGAYLLDRDPDQNGVFDELPNAYHAIRPFQNVAPNASLGEFDVTPGGAFVTFSSPATNLAGIDTNGTYDVFRWERATGAIIGVSVTGAGTYGNAISRHPSISDDGNLVAFETQSSNLAPGTSAFGGDILVRDVAAGSTAPASVSSSGILGNGLSLRPDISGDGRSVAFVSYARNFDPRDTDFQSDVYVRDRLAGTVELVSVDSFGSKGIFGSTDPFVSHDGNRVCFASQATNLYWNDVFAARDVFVRDRAAGWTRQVSVASDGEHGNAPSAEGFGIDFSSDGAHAAFHSAASNLVAGDTNGMGDLFVHDVCPDGGTELGFALTGQQGLSPELRACGALSSGSHAVLSLVNARPSRIGAVFTSSNQVNTPKWGGTLVPGGPFLLRRFVTDASGKASVTLPGGGGPGTVYVHAVVRDGGAPQGVAFSNALALPVLP